LIRQEKSKVVDWGNTRKLLATYILQDRPLVSMYRTCGSGPLLRMTGYSTLWVGYKLFLQAMDLNIGKSGVYKIYLACGGFDLITRESVK
jgi:hypothetical protein